MRDTIRDEVHLSEPVTVVAGALAVPPGRHRDATVVDAHGAPVVDAGTFRHDRYVPAQFLDRATVQPNVTHDGTWLFGGVFWLHFGHFLFETISRLWVVDGLRGKVDGIAFFRAHAHRPPPKIFHDILKRLDVDLPITFIDAPTGFERLVVPRQGCGMGALSAGTPAFRAFVQEKLHRIEPRRGAEKIYLTREGYRLKRGGIFAETLLRERLEAEGYVAFAPEQHSFQDQVATYLGARHILGPDSSALHLVGFATPPEAEVGILLRRPDGERDMLPQLTGFMGRKPLVVDAIARLIRRDNERNPNWSMFAELDMPQLAEALRAGGFVTGADPWPALPRVLRKRLLAVYEKQLGAAMETVWLRGQRLPDGLGAGAADAD